jgi:hypothetical protein
MPCYFTDSFRLSCSYYALSQVWPDTECIQRPPKISQLLTPATTSALNCRSWPTRDADFVPRPLLRAVMPCGYRADAHTTEAP